MFASPAGISPMKKRVMRSLAVAIVAWTFMTAVSGSNAIAQPYGGVGSSSAQFTINDAPPVNIQGVTSVQYPSSSYTFPGSTGVVTSEASILNTVQPSVAAINSDINVSFAGNLPGGSGGSGVEETMLSFLDPVLNRPPPNVNYLYYIESSFHITGHVAAGDTIEISISTGYFGSAGNFQSYGNDFGPGNFDVSMSKGPFALGNYFQGGTSGVTDIGMAIEVFMIRASDSTQEQSYINVDPTADVFSPSAVPEPPGLVMLGLGILSVLTFSCSRKPVQASAESTQP
jgi:hypothetical protein